MTQSQITHVPHTQGLIVWGNQTNKPFSSNDQCGKFHVSAEAQKRGIRLQGAEEMTPELIFKKLLFWNNFLFLTLRCRFSNIHDGRENCKTVWWTTMHPSSSHNFHNIANLISQFFSIIEYLCLFTFLILFYVASFFWIGSQIRPTYYDK